MLLRVDLYRKMVKGLEVRALGGVVQSFLFLVLVVVGGFSLVQNILNLRPKRVGRPRSGQVLFKRVRARQPQT